MMRLSMNIYDALPPNAYRNSESKEISKEDVSVIKHSLLASTLLVTGCPQANIENRQGLDRYLDILKESLQNRNTEIVLTAHQCLRNLVMLPSKKANVPSAVKLGQVMTKRVIPHIIVPYLLSQEDDSDSQDSQQANEEAIKTLLMVHNVAENEKSKMVFNIPEKGFKRVDR
jgi:hypothetical protein